MTYEEIEKEIKEKEEVNKLFLVLLTLVSTFFLISIVTANCGKVYGSPIVTVERIVEIPKTEYIVVEKEVHNLDEGQVLASYSGNFELTAYCSCAACCGKSNGITASGAKVSDGITVASNFFPLGTTLYIDGVGERVVQDTGGMAKNVIDVYMPSHSQALQFGRRKNVEVYVLDKS